MSGQKYIVAATVAQGFWRCGRFWTKAGVVVVPDEFSETDWERIFNEPKLRVKPATTTDTDVVNARLDQITEAIKSLKPADFQRDGKPKVDALNDLLGDGLDTKITASERNAVWDQLIVDGFEPPTGNE